MPPHVSKRNDDQTTSIWKIVAAAFAAGTVLFGYGVGASLGVVPGRGFIIGAFVYVAAAIGAVLVSSMALVTIYLRRTDRLPRLTRRQCIGVSVTAPVIAAVAMALTRSWSVETVVYNLWFLTWTFLGQTLLSIQFLVGSMHPARQRHTVLATETVVVSGAIAAFLFVTHDPVSPGSLLFLSGGGAVTFLLFGGLFFLLGRSMTITTDR